MKVLLCALLFCGIGLGLGCLGLFVQASPAQPSAAFQPAPVRYASARPRRSPTARAVESRQPGGDLRFTGTANSYTITDLSSLGVTANPVLAFELGDCVAEESIERVIPIGGGFRPYSVSSAGLKDRLAALGQPASFSLSEAGILTGGFLEGAVAPADLFFDVQVLDSAGLGSDGQPLSGVFHLRLVSDGVLRFAQNTFPSAPLGLDYVTRIQLLNAGMPPCAIRIRQGSILLDGSPVEDLEDLGLSLNKDGTLYGRPLQAGTLTFTAEAFTVGGTPALDFQGAAAGQAVSIVIEPNEETNSTLFAYTCTIHGFRGQGCGDTLNFLGQLHLDGQLLAKLAGTPVKVRIAGGKWDPAGDPEKDPDPLPDASGQTSKPTRDDEYALNRARGLTLVGQMEGEGLGEGTGNLNCQLGLVADGLLAGPDGYNQEGELVDPGDGYDLKVSVSRRGLLRISAKRLNLYRSLHAVSQWDGEYSNLVLQVQLGRNLACETISMRCRATKTAYLLEYTLANSAANYKGQPLAGVFQVTALQGEDVGRQSQNDTTNPGTRYTMEFFGAPRFGIEGSDGLATTSSLSVVNTAGYEEEGLALDTSKAFHRYTNATSAEFKFNLIVINPKKFRHFLRTFKIPELEHNIPQAGPNDSLSEFFDFYLEAGDGFKGAASRTIYPYGSHYVDLP